MRCILQDDETRSTLNLRRVGSYIYAHHPTTDALCVSYCLITDNERGPIKTWRPGDPTPMEIINPTTNSETLIATHHDAFERQIEEHILHPRYGWPLFPLERRRCTQATALSYALPASLDAVAAALKLNVRKTGRRQEGNEATRPAAQTT